MANQQRFITHIGGGSIGLDFAAIFGFTSIAARNDSYFFILRLKMPHIRDRVWHMWCPDMPAQPIDVEIQPVLLANHTDSLLRAALDGAGITSVAVDMVAPHLARGELVRVLSPWITGRLSIYAAVPSRKFMPQRTRAFLDFLIEETRLQTAKAMEACASAAKTEGVQGKL